MSQAGIYIKTAVRVLTLAIAPHASPEQKSSLKNIMLNM